jgi:predicted metal-binding protein
MIFDNNLDGQLSPERHASAKGTELPLHQVAHSSPSWEANRQHRPRSMENWTMTATFDYVVVVQCDIVMERCSGYFCEKALNERSGGFGAFPGSEQELRSLYLTCGGCCGRAVLRKLSDLIRSIKKKEGITKDRIVVQLASCIIKDNYHGLPCPHIGLFSFQGDGVASSPGRSQ